MKTHKKKIAAALRYRPGVDQAPTVVAVGKGDLANAIEKMAQENNVPLFKDAALAHTLTELGLGVEIPPQLYEAIAKLLIHVAAMDKKL